MRILLVHFRGHEKQGMTLIEVILALFLFGILATFVIQVMGSVLNLWSAGERRGRGDLVFASAVERFRSDLEALHNGPRGWMILDTWEVPPSEEGQLAWVLPRLRFLADGAALPESDPTGRAAVEVMWAVVPEDVRGSRFGRLKRFAKPENPNQTLQDSAVANDLLRSTAGLVVMDGVLWAEFSPSKSFAASGDRFRIDAFQPYGFPSAIELALEMVSGNAREHPPLLDSFLGAEPQTVRMRGVAPMVLPTMALLEHEWIRIAGRFPNLSFAGRAQRNTLAVPHAARTKVYMPTRYHSVNPVAAQGRRLP